MAQRQVDLSAYIPPGVSSSGTGQGSLTRGQLIVDIEFDDNDDHFGTTPTAAPTPQKATPVARPSTPAPPPTPQKAARPQTPAPQRGLQSQTIAPQPGVSSVTVQGTGRQVPTTNIRYAKPSKFVSVQARSNK